ncbi:MAG TPA: UPF0182 family protein, partial [Gemmatimonadales bacterium]
SESVAAAGSRRALLGLALELAVVLVAVAWLAVNLLVAARAALPSHPPPERQSARIWPERVPRWTLLAAAVVLGVLLGSGASAWLDELLLTLDGVRFGLTDPLLGADLAVFLQDFPLWLHLQARVVVLVGAALLSVVLLHLAGGTLRILERRVWVSPRARGHLALLLALLGLALAWRSALEPFRLAAGLRGPILSSEFLLRTLVAEVEAVLGAIVAVVSFFWWLRIRGSIALGVWVLFGLTVLGGRILPLHTELATADEGWRASARALDSVAFGLAAVEVRHPKAGRSGASFLPSLWDPGILAASVRDSGDVTGVSQATITAPGGPTAPVWLAIRQGRSAPPELLALSDDRVSPAGGPLAWRPGDSVAVPEPVPYRELGWEVLRPGAPAVGASLTARGVVLSGWPRRLLLAWALQSGTALSAPRGTRLAWRLDPGVRLRAIAPFAQWGEPRPQIHEGQLVWVSDGQLISSLFPSSIRLDSPTGGITMMRPAFLGLVEATTGSVRIFRRDQADSLSAAWARIARPLVEPASAIPRELRQGEMYPRELLLAQARVLQGPAWHAGKLPRTAQQGDALAPSYPGGAEALVPLLNDKLTEVQAFLRARRTPAGDTLELIRIDPPGIESPSALDQRWKRFPFQQQLAESVKAAGSGFENGMVRYTLTPRGIAAFQPVWAVSPSGHARLVLVNLAQTDSSSGQRVGAGRTIEEGWTNLRGQASPTPVGSGPNAVLELARQWMRRADSALRRGDFQELGRALAQLRDLLEPPK